VCNSALWRHIYSPERLRIIVPCLSVTGRVVLITPERDGDATIHLRVSEPNGELVHAEIVCKLQGHPGTCGSYVSDIVAPKKGERVVVTGPLVRDSHGNIEIHPVSSVKVLKPLVAVGVGTPDAPPTGKEPGLARRSALNIGRPKPKPVTGGHDA